VSFDPAGAPVASSRRGFFWVGIEPVAQPLGTVLRGPMYVHWEQPAEVEADPRRPPWILVHGGGGQGTDYLGTPDGRLGWARLLVAQGHTVFVVDRPGHGRSPHHPEVLGPMGPQAGFEYLRPIFVPPPEGEDSHPTSAQHTQWPGGREPGDPVLDQWLAPAGPMLAVGPPFVRLPEAGLDLTWGVTTVPIEFDPAVGSAAELELVTEVRQDEFGPIPVTLQRDGAVRRLANLGRFPIAVVTGEASLFAQFDRHLVAFLEQAGCEVQLIRLADHGVHGNGHGIMLERNHEQALAVLAEWASRVAIPQGTCGRWRSASRRSARR
jgi:acetyl esterase/lipase